MTSIAIMQPTYLPWLGYVALMDRVDQFVFLDSVQFDRSSWQQRNRIKGANGVQMLTIPVFKKEQRSQTISEVRINREAGFPEKHIRTITHCYAKAPFFDDYAPELFELMRRPRALLAELTIDIIGWIAAKLGIATPCLRSSGLKASGTKADLLAAICGEIGATRYVSPPASRAYLENSDAFERLSVPVVYNDYDHPDYPQLHGAFEPSLSVIDLLFNCGPESLGILRQGIR